MHQDIDDWQRKLGKSLFGICCLLAASACQPGAEPQAKPGKKLQAHAETDAARVESAASSMPAADAALQQQLLQALQPQADGSDRFLLAEPVVKAYADAGYVNAEADVRMDYSDYHLLRKPAKLLGHDLLLIDNEYMQEYVGCCVSHGLSVTVKLLPGGEDLLAFAAANGCSYNPDSEEYFPARDAGLPPAPVGTYANISCKERDVPLDD